MHGIVPDSLRIVMGEMREFPGGCVFLQVTTLTKDRAAPALSSGPAIDVEKH